MTVKPVPKGVVSERLEPLLLKKFSTPLAALVVKTGRPMKRRGKRCRGASTTVKPEHNAATEAQAQSDDEGEGGAACVAAAACDATAAVDHVEHASGDHSDDTRSGHSGSDNDSSGVTSPAPLALHSPHGITPQESEVIQALLLL